MNRCLNLDSNFVPIKFPEIGYKLFNFNGGETHIKLNTNIYYSNINEVILTHRIRNGNNIMEILIAHDALKLMGVKNFSLVISYVPYARQDRKCEEGESFSLKVFARLINSMNFNKVYVVDSHSDVAVALIDNCINISNENYIHLTLNDLKKTNKNLLLVSPDAGANKKSNKLMSAFPNYFDSIIKCDKRRDTKTGLIYGIEVFAGDLNKTDCLIVDDICDGGATFINVAKELQNHNCGDLYLFVTHGIFSKGFDELNKYYKKIYCTNSFSDINDASVIQYKIQI